MSWVKLLRRDFRIWAITFLFAVLGFFVSQVALVPDGGRIHASDFGIVDCFFIMLLPTIWMTVRFVAGAPWAIRITEVLDEGCSWLPSLREKAHVCGVDDLRFIEMESRWVMGANAVSPNLVLLPSRLKQLLDSEEQFAVAFRELAHLIQMNEYDKDADRQRWIGATLAVAALFSGGIVSLVDHWLTLRGSALLGWEAVVPIALLAYALGALTAAGAEGFCNSTTAVDAKSVSMGVDPRVLLSALAKIGFADGYFSAKRAPKYATRWGWKLNRRIRQLVQRAGLTTEELEQLYRSLAAENAPS